jgi:hypothetical protein
MINEIVWYETLRISQKDFDHRKSTCVSCEDFRVEEIKCNVCGCPAANFWVSPESSCPAGKFTAILVVEHSEEKTTEGTSTIFERDTKPA